LVAAPVQIPAETRDPVAICGACGRYDRVSRQTAPAGRHARTGWATVSGDFRDL